MTIDTPFPGKIHYYESVSSTMELARRAASGDAETGTVFWAGHQSAGRGRIEGRRWEDVSGESLLFTVLIPKALPVFPVTAFPLAVGLAAAGTLEGYGLTPEIKWPNDLLCRRGKAAGILCETCGNYLAAGVGINVLQKSFPAELGSKPVSLAMLMNNPPAPAKVLQDFLFQLHRVLNLETWKPEVEARLFNKGGLIEVEMGLPGEGALRRRGILNGIGKAGEMILTSPEGESFAVFSGEVRLNGGYGTGS